MTLPCTQSAPDGRGDRRYEALVGDIPPPSRKRRAGRGTHEAGTERTTQDGSSWSRGGMGRAPDPGRASMPGMLSLLGKGRRPTDAPMR